MAPIGIFKNEAGGLFVDNSVFVSSQHTNTNNISMKQNGSACEGKLSIRFAGKRGQKIDLYRVIIALLENGFFTDNSGAKPTQKEVFEAFGKMLGADFSDFQKNLSQSRLNNNDSEAPTQIFDTLKKTIEEYYKIK